MYNSRNKDNVKLYKYYKNAKDNNKYLPKNFTNKKKIRNWKTILKRLNELRNDNLFESMQEMKDALINCDYHYLKIYIDPFSRIEKRNPPQWFRKLIIQAFIEVYNNWEYYAKKLNMPYYLKLWIYENEFSRSQIVMGIRDKMTHYQNLFDPHETDQAFPHEQYSSEHCDTKQINWRYAKVLSPFEKEDLDYFNTKYLNSLFNENRIQPYYGFKDVCPDTEYVLIHEDNLWLGEKL